MKRMLIIALGLSLTLCAPQAHAWQCPTWLKSIGSWIKNNPTAAIVIGATIAGAITLKELLYPSTSFSPAHSRSNFSHALWLIGRSETGNAGLYSYFKTKNTPGPMPSTENDTYKIHLAVNPHDLIRFVQELQNFFKKNQDLPVSLFKVINPYSKCTPPSTKERLPVIAIYLDSMPTQYTPPTKGEIQKIDIKTTVNERNRIIADIINKMIKHFKEKFGTSYGRLCARDWMDRPLQPRYNRHVKDFIFLAQGNADYKGGGPGTGDNNMTEDLAFFKGYEFDQSLINQ